MIDTNGIAHIAITVNRFDLCKVFYQKFLPFIGLKAAFVGEKQLYYVGPKTAVGIGACEDKYRNEKFVQTRIGLHHLCFKARSKDDVDKAHVFLEKIGAKIVHAPEEGPWAPGYYSVLFEDPDGIRLEINFVPGKGLLEEGKKFNPAGDYC
jgi:catechol 2,3-dioxygenase-like lactoylglutathione lyase family enzyme